MTTVKAASIVLLLLVSAKASPPGTLIGTPVEETINVTSVTPPPDVKEIAPQGAPNPVTSFRVGMMAYEKRIKVFIENTRREYLTTITDSATFLEELSGYMDQLPKNTTKVIEENYRSKCYCEGQYWEPCPERCMDSCYIQGYDRYDNCTLSSYYRKGYTCYCFDGSSQRCTRGIENCYSQRFKVVPDTHPCSNSSVDESTVKESFSRFSDLLVEPLKILVRGLEFKLTSLRQSVVATEILSNVTSDLCEGNDPSCLPEAAELLKQKLDHFRQSKKNITLDMIKVQNKAEAVAKDVDELKEQTFAQINRSIKEYTCCLKGLQFTVKDNDCSPKPPDSPPAQRLRPLHVGLAQRRTTSTTTAGSSNENTADADYAY